MTTHADLKTTGRPPALLTINCTSTRAVPDVPGAVHITTVPMIAVPAQHVAVYLIGFVGMFAAALAVIVPAILTR